MTERVLRQGKIPRPWFHANNSAGPMMGIYKVIDAWERPLNPGERQLGNFILPPFQRPSVWTLEQKVRFIESIWGRLPLGAYVVNRVIGDRSCDGWLLDGQQRITAIMEYVEDQFPVFGYLWSELDLLDHRNFAMIPMACLETQLTDHDKLREIYDRLAYGGTPHDLVDRLVPINMEDNHGS